MAPVVLAGMLFTIVILAMLGGFILLLPITRRVGAILEQRLNEKSVQGSSAAQVQQLQAMVRQLQAEVEQLAERQDFTEALLQEQPRMLPREEGRS
jgi:TolA-binding protein